MDQHNMEIHELFLRQFTANQAAIRAYVRRLVPTRHDAADVMQGIALVLWKKFSELAEQDDFRKWSFGVARYETLAWLRDKGRDRLILSNEVLNIVADESAKIESHLSSQREALESCLEKLPSEQRSWILVAYTPDSHIQEVAEQSGKTVSAFYQWLHRIRMRLLECTRRTLQMEGML